MIRDKAAAVLYADAAAPGGFDVQALEALMRVASMAIELLPLRRSTEPLSADLPNPRILTASLPGAGTAATAALKTETHRLETAAEVHHLQENQSDHGPDHGSDHGPNHGPDHAPVGGLVAGQDDGQDDGLSEPNPVEQGLRQTVTEPQPAIETNHNPAVSSEIGVLIDSTPTDPREHLNARRFARFLVGEIRLYQPSRVIEGCRRADLYDRLRDEIERSRKLYERHVRAQITAEFDYFYHELVTTLAEGDATRLGRNFPSPQV